jgi:ferredoxin
MFMKKTKTPQWIRWGLLALILIWVTYEAIMHQVLGGGKAPSIHALCPYGALESLYSLIVSGTFLQKIYTGTVIILVVTVLIAIFFRRSFCGLLCPFGALQELFARVGKKILGKRPAVPVRADKYLRYLKYAVLVLTVFMAWRLGRLWMSSYDPYAAYGHITAIPATLAEDPLSIIGFIILGVTLIGSFVYDRFFCKYLCPAGAFYALLGKISPTKIERSNELCVHCNLCTRACPVNLDVAKMDCVTSMECLNCNECVSVCPKKGALEIKTFRKRVSPVVIIVLVAGLFFIPLFAAQAAGVFQLAPERIKENETIAITEVKGYMTITDAAAAVGMPEEQFRAVMKIPESVPSSTLMKGISELVAGYDFDLAKEDAGAVLAPASPAASAPPSQQEPEAAAGSATAKVDVHLVKGSMSISDASAAVGLSREEFYQLFEIPETVSPSTRMKDIANVAPGYNLDAVKAALE